MIGNFFKDIVLSILLKAHDTLQTACANIGERHKILTLSINNYKFLQSLNVDDFWVFYYSLVLC